MFPLPDEKLRDELAQEWLVIWQWPWKMPIIKIRQYFGAQIALYNAFLSHFTAWAIALAVLAAPTTIEMIHHADGGTTDDDEEGEPTPVLRVVFLMSVTAWCVLMLETWKQKQARIAMKCGTTDAARTAPTRPEFEAVTNGQSHKGKQHPSLHCTTE